MTSVFPMSISQLANAADTSVYVVRNYTLEGLLECRKSPNNGYGLYEEPALERLRLIRRALDAGLSLCEIRPLIKAIRGRDRQEMVSVIEVLHNKIQASQQRLRNLDQVLMRLPEQPHKYLKTI
ncbi:MAG: MerR family transcriptional regulator [Cellvibrionaceae bacterium]|nr:MerR family transcriptional regulator [Motiliproteus sp.]MCW9052174.1 MerR family transcriptional regulator [Motiliproteus sp.]